MEKQDYSEAFNNMKLNANYKFPERVFIKIENSKDILTAAFEYFIKKLDLNKTFTWLPEYDQVAEWLNDNNGSGLFLYGANGRGKTLLSQIILPAIFLKHFRKVIHICDAQEMNRTLDNLLSKKILSVDDIGTEDIINDFGEKRWAFPELIDRSEKRGNLLIITTNLNAQSIEAKYGIRTIERIKKTCTRIKFDGNSLR